MHLSSLIAALLLASATLNPALAQTDPAADAETAARHNSEEWRLLEPYLPSLTTGTPAELTQEGDVLRARRFEEDALTFYTAALRRGGDQATVLNRIGVTYLVLRQPDIARASFHRVLALSPDNAQAWNNLGAAEYFAGNHRAALEAYLHAVRLDGKDAVFHSNLATAYFELKDYESAADHFQRAFRLDNKIFERVSMGGLEARMLSATERGRFCFELARVAAQQHQDESVLHWLRKALDAGYDIRAEMDNYVAFAPYQHDSRVTLLIANARAMRAGRLASNIPIPSLADVTSTE